VCIFLSTFLLYCFVQMEEKFDHFCKTFAVGPSLAKLVRAVWLLDHGNVQVSSVVNAVMTLYSMYLLYCTSLHGVYSCTTTVKLRYNVFLGTVKNSTMYQRYVVTTKERSSYFIINPNPVNQTLVHYSALLYCFLKKLSKVIWVVQRPFDVRNCSTDSKLIWAQSLLLTPSR